MSRKRQEIADILGSRRNMLVAIGVVERDRRRYLVCKCDCGNETTIRATFFTTGKTKSCGCYGSRNSIYRINRKRSGESARTSHYNAYRTHARQRKIEFALTKDEFESLTGQPCHYCNSAPKVLPYPNAYGEAFGNGVDRINSEVGYFFVNCLPACWDCNRMKGTLSYTEFLTACKRVADFHRAKMDFSTIWDG